MLKTVRVAVVVPPRGLSARFDIIPSSLALIKAQARWYSAEHQPTPTEIGNAKLRDKLKSDLKAAMIKVKEVEKGSIQDQHKLSVSVIKSLISDISYNGKAGNNAQPSLAAVVQKAYKRREDAIEQFNAADRPELAEKEKLELQIIEQYLPKPIDSSEMEAIVKRILEQTPGLDKGKIMKSVFEEVDQGAVNKKTLSEIVSKLVKK
ncbi:Yqey-like protein-domain-containing protein [Cladochytrium replicatum]|nr:Yqey-like protein-domain-containing protein [Cladochytrium replicatum]